MTTKGGWLFAIATSTTLASPALADQRYTNSSPRYEVSYPSGWQPMGRIAGLAMFTRTRLAGVRPAAWPVCSIAPTRFRQLVGIPRVELDEYRRSNHGPSFFRRLFGFGTLRGSKLVKYSRGRLGRSMAGIAEYHRIDPAIDGPMRGWVAATYFPGYRVILSCAGGAGAVRHTRSAFDLMRSSLQWAATRE